MSSRIRASLSARSALRPTAILPGQAPACQLAGGNPGLADGVGLWPRTGIDVSGFRRAWMIEPVPRVFRAASHE
jgi:hypothetical protein